LIDVREEFSVQASPDSVWEIVSNPYEVVSCIPGASITAQREDGSYTGSIGIKFGPTSIAFQTLVTLELIPDLHEGRLVSQAKDSRGGARTKATMSFSVKPSGDKTGSIIAFQGTVEISGPLASMVEDGASFVIKRMVAVFAERLAEKCSPPKTPEEMLPRPTASEERSRVGVLRGLWLRVLRVFRRASG
jgi:carbon monoxide dehydrogenase subunit G